MSASRSQVLFIGTLFSLSIFSTARPAEFLYQGKVIRSVVTKQASECKGFTVDVVVDAFPMEYASQESAQIIPSGMTIKHSETDIFVSADVYALIGDRKIKLPAVDQMIARRRKLAKLFPRAGNGAQYLPISKATCTMRGFSVNYWIGGNGNGADYILEFVVDRNKISLPGYFSDTEFDELTNESR